MEININDRKEMVRFVAAGFILGAIDFGLYFILINFLIFPLAKGISFTCANIAGYLLNKYWTFRHKPPSYAEIARYIAVILLALAVNVLINQWFLDLRPGSVFIALLIASTLTGLLTFICFKWWVFKAH